MVMQQNLKQLQGKLKDSFAQRYRYKGTDLSSTNSRMNERDRLHHSLVQHPNKFNEDVSNLNQRSNDHRDQEFQNILQQLRSSIHNEDSCLCNDCHCGRHLCKFTAAKPNLSKSTVYKRMFSHQPSKQIENVIVKAMETSPLKGYHLDMNTEYLQKYKNIKLDKIEKPKPEDTLKFNGPPQSITTYGHQFPGHRGSNQYVKPTNKHAIGESSLNGQTVYSMEFTLKKNSKEEMLKHPDHLRTGSNWYGNGTAYGSHFKALNPEENHLAYFPRQQSEKYQKMPNVSNHFDTFYRQEYQPKQSPLCPSKIQLQRSPSPLFENTKNNFQQNSDFRSMSPQFKAIATSKHFYV